MLSGTKKYSMEKFGKKCYLLGQDKKGTNYFLESATWDCDWYWDGGYVDTYTCNSNPVLSRDIDSHLYFDRLFFSGCECAFDKFKAFFLVNPFTESEIWEICELMKSFYTARKYSDMLHAGGARYTSNPAADIIKSEDEYKRINEKVIPEIMTALYGILEVTQ